MTPIDPFLDGLLIGVKCIFSRHCVANVCKFVTGLSVILLSFAGNQKKWALLSAIVVFNEQIYPEFYEQVSA